MSSPETTSQPISPQRRPDRLTAGVGLVSAGGFVTLLTLYLDHRSWVLPPLLVARSFRDAFDVVGVLVTIALAVATLRGLRWARRTLIAACAVYAAANSVAVLLAGFVLIAGPRALVSDLPAAGGATEQSFVTMAVVTLIGSALVGLMTVISAVLLSGRAHRAAPATSNGSAG